MKLDFTSTIPKTKLRNALNLNAERTSKKRPRQPREMVMVMVFYEVEDLWYLTF